MIMSRPLIQRGVGDLEALFAHSKTDISALEQLEHELQHRQMPRAVALLAEVRAAIDSASRGSTSTKEDAAPQQKGLWEQSIAPGIAAPTAAPVPVERVRAPADLIVPMKKKDSAPSISLEDAYKLLQANSGSAWESIEQVRRQLVQQSNPARLKTMSPEKRDQALEEVKMVNAAYAVLSRARCSYN